MSEFMYPSFAYEKKGDGAVILRCFSRDGTVQLPERLGGLPVRELGAYAFSDHMDESGLKGAKYACGTADESMKPCSPDEPCDRNIESSGAGEPCNQSIESPGSDALCDRSIESSGLPALSGDGLEEIILPRTINRVGRYCFYNCGHLRRLEFPGTLADWGSGAFTGCHRIKQLCVRANPEEATGLKQVLDELPEELCVEFCRDEQMNPTESGASDGSAAAEKISAGSSAVRALLTFPEFYEEGVENTPARILETHVHGTGIRYRNSFQGKQFDFALYDSLFPYAKAQENELLLTELVLGRLRFPCHLGEQEKLRYEGYVRENLNTFGTYFLDQKDPGGLQWFLERFAAGKENLLDFLSEYAVRHGDAPAQSRLMEFRRGNGTGVVRRRRLEL